MEQVEVTIDETTFLAFVDAALPDVYHYLLRRVGEVSLAEDLTSETVLGALASIRRQGLAGDEWSVAWLVGIARHKLIDHWRRQSREERNLAAVGAPIDMTWDEPIESSRASQVLSALNASQRAALTLRYCDGLPVARVAELLGRSVSATENLLARSRQAFRTLYGQQDGDGGD